MRVEGAHAVVTGGSANSLSSAVASGPGGGTAVGGGTRCSAATATSRPMAVPQRSASACPTRATPKAGSATTANSRGSLGSTPASLSQRDARAAAHCRKRQLP